MIKKMRTSLEVQRLRFHPSTAGGVGLIPGWEIKTNMLQYGQKEEKKQMLKEIQ